MLIADVYIFLFLIPIPRFAQWEWFEVDSAPYLKCSMLALFLAQCQKRKKGYCLVSWKRKSLRWNMFMPSLLLEGAFLSSCCFSDDIHFQNLGKSERQDPTKFALVWNQIMNSFRTEDLISNRYVLVIPVQHKFHQYYFFSKFKKKYYFFSPSNFIGFAERWIWWQCPCH